MMTTFQFWSARSLTGLFWVLCIAIAAYGGQLFLGDLQQKLPFMLYHVTARPVMLLTHIGASACALVLMLIQLLPQLRRARPGLHRWAGRFYGVAILVGGAAGLGLSVTSEAPLVARAGFATLALVWIGATACGIWHVRAGRLAAHRTWMLRSAALTFAAVTLRLLLPVLLASGVPFELAYSVVAWACWLPNLVVVELVLNRAGVARRNVAPA